MIEVRDLVKCYGDHTAVDHLSFTVQKGQIYGFLGPNGAGKSTTMNIMTGYIGMTGGEVLINGYNIMEEPEEARKCIGYLPEQPPLYNDMTVIEYLIFAAELKKMDKDIMAEEIEKVVKLTKLGDMCSRLIKNLSKGYRQRVGLAQAILGFPEIIILDEPTVGLDPKQIIEIRDMIRNLAKDHTVILSSHILSEVQEICDQVLIIDRGHLVASGTPVELEKRMRTSVIEVALRTNSEDKAREVFKDIPGIEEAEFNLVNGSNEMNVKINTNTDTDVREDIFNACVKAGVPLLVLKPEDLSLEHIFLEVTETSENVNTDGEVDEK